MIQHPFLEETYRRQALLGYAKWLKQRAIYWRRRSIKSLLFSTEMPCFVAFSTCGVSAGFLRISGSLLVAEGT